jgi:hypothetical protein
VEQLFRRVAADLIPILFVRRFAAFGRTIQEIDFAWALDSGFFGVSKRLDCELVPTSLFDGRPRRDLSRTTTERLIRDFGAIVNAFSN